MKADYDRILKMYCNILSSKAPDPGLQRELRQGLESVFDQVESEASAETLEREIDFEALNRMHREKHNKPRSQGQTPTAVLRNACGLEGIKTYGDLVRFARKYGIEYRQGGINHAKWRSLELLRVGYGISVLLYQHLDSLGIKLFGNDYTPQELGKAK